MPGPVFLAGDRVVLRTVEDEDLALFRRAHDEPGFREGLLFRRPQNREAVAEYVAERTGGDDDVLLLACRDEQALGAVALFDVAREHATLAYWLLAAHRGEGYATEAAGLAVDYAFDALGLHHLVAWTVADNAASRAVLDRLGFREEGRLREHVYRDGGYHDAVYYGLLPGEWDGADATA